MKFGIHVLGWESCGCISSSRFCSWLAIVRGCLSLIFGKNRAKALGINNNCKKIDN